jgi:hypothetical protein
LGSHFGVGLGLLVRLCGWVSLIQMGQNVGGIWFVIYVRVAIEVESLLMMMIVVDVIAMMIHPIKPRRLELRHEATVPCSDKYSLEIHVFVQSLGNEPKRDVPWYVQAALEMLDMCKRSSTQNSTVTLPSAQIWYCLLRSLVCRLSSTVGMV